MRILAVETYPAKPHLETAGEILLNESVGGDVGFSYLGGKLPWQEYPQDSLGWGALLDMPTRVEKFKKLLSSRHIEIADVPVLSNELIENIRRWAGDFDGDVFALKKYAYKGHALGLGVASSLISKYRNSALDTAENMQEIRLALQAAGFVYERALLVIARYQPEIVLTFNGRFACSYPVIKATQESRCKIWLHERGCDYRKYEVFTASVHSLENLRERIDLHWASCPDIAEARAVGEKFFLRRRAGDGVGWKSFIDGQTRGLIIPRNARKRVVYFSSSEEEQAATEDGAVQRFAPEGQKEAVRKLIRVCQKLADIDLVVRVHPNAAGSHEDELAWWASLAQEGVHVILPTAKEDSYALLESADLVCSYGSTIGVEAAFWGKASVLLGDAGYYGFGCCAEPQNEGDLERLIREVPTHWDREACLRYGYYVATFGRAYKYYRPTSLFEGELLGDPLSHRSVLGAMVAWLRQTYQKILTKRA